AAPNLIASRAPATMALQKTATPDAPKCELVAQQLAKPLTDTVKSVVVVAENEEGSAIQTVLLLVRGDHDVNEIKVSKLPGFEQGYRPATEDEILSDFGCIPGYLGPIATARPVRAIADTTVAHMSD